MVQKGKQAKRAIIASYRTRRFARLAQIHRCAKKASLRMTIKLRHYSNPKNFFIRFRPRSSSASEVA